MGVYRLANEWVALPVVSPWMELVVGVVWLVEEGEEVETKAYPGAAMAE